MKSKKKWEIEVGETPNEVETFLAAGWEPFAVILDKGFFRVTPYIFFKRQSSTDCQHEWNGASGTERCYKCEATRPGGNKK